MCIGTCDDPFVTYLKTVGYNAIRLPRANLRPLQLLAKSGKELTWLGDVVDVFVPEKAGLLPPVESDVRAAGIEGKRTGDLSIGVGLSLLGSVIGALGGSKLGLDIAYKNAKSAAFEFTEVWSDSVSLTKLDQFLGASDVNPANVTIAQMLDADEIYVTTNTIKSNKFTVEAKKSDGGSFDVSVPIIQEAVGGSIKVTGNREISTKVTYEGTTKLVFGFQAVQLYYDNGAYTAFKPLDAGKIAAKALSAVPQDRAERLVTAETFTRIRVQQ